MNAASFCGMKRLAEQLTVLVSMCVFVGTQLLLKSFLKLKHSLFYEIKQFISTLPSVFTTLSSFQDFIFHMTERNRHKMFSLLLSLHYTVTYGAATESNDKSGLTPFSHSLFSHSITSAPPCMQNVSNPNQTN